MAVNVVAARRDYTEVTPDAQASTNTYADVTGSTLDARDKLTVAYTVVNGHATRVLHWKVLAGHDASFADAVEVKAEADVAGTASDNYSTTTAVWSYYKVQIQSGAPNNAVDATVRGIAKG